LRGHGVRAGRAQHWAEKIAMRALRVPGTVFSHAMLEYAWKSARAGPIAWQIVDRCASVLW